MVSLTRVLAWSLLLLAQPLQAAPSVVLPTPLEAYKDYDPSAEALVLFSELLQALPPERQAAVSQVAMGARMGLPPPSAEQLIALLKELDWQKEKPRVLRLMVYQSGVLEVVAAQSPSWMHFVHDFILFFLDHLPEDRLVARIASQVQLSQGEGGDPLLALIDRTPTLQKLGQILARFPGVPPPVQQQLQQLENGISTSKRSDIVSFITEDVGVETLQRDQVHFDEELLAEATIGAVISATLVEAGKTRPTRIVCKVVKPYAVEALGEELSILDGLVLYFEQNAAFYELGQIPLSKMFEDVKTALQKEVRIVDEQHNLQAAFEYYGDNPDVIVPRVLPQSTPNVTFMDYIEGGKIVDSFPGDPAQRAIMARKLDEVMTVEVIFSRREIALFHGDPHAGNVFFVAAGSGNPHRIALLDWGLRGELSREQRQQLIQLMLGIKLRNSKRVRNNSAVLLEGGFPSDPAEAERIQSRAVAVLDSAESADPFIVLSSLVTDLTTLGYRLEFNIVLFIKAQVTILGILEELDPELDRKKVMSSYLAGATFKEMPKRALNTVYFPKWTAHNYPTMISNEDMRDVCFQSTGRGFKKFGGWIWSGLTFPFRGSADPRYEKKAQPVPSHR